MASLRAEDELFLELQEQGADGLARACKPGQYAAGIAEYRRAQALIALWDRQQIATIERRKGAA